jgi:hypothetical protein
VLPTCLCKEASFSLDDHVTCFHYIGINHFPFSDYSFKWVLKIYFVERNKILLFFYLNEHNDFFMFPIQLMKFIGKFSIAKSYEFLAWKVGAFFIFNPLFNVLIGFCKLVAKKWSCKNWFVIFLFSIFKLYVLIYVVCLCRQWNVIEFDKVDIEAWIESIFNG